MRWNITEPLGDTGRLEPRQRIEAARNSLINNTQLLLGQERDEVALGLDEPGNMGILRAQVGDDPDPARDAVARNLECRKAVRIEAQKTGSPCVPKPFDSERKKPAHQAKTETSGRGIPGCHRVTGQRPRNPG